MGFWPQLYEWISFRGILGHILATAAFKDSIAEGTKKEKKTSAKDNLGGLQDYNEKKNKKKKHNSLV